jgi:hypothetical protein
MKPALALAALLLLCGPLVASCTEADREAMFSTDRPPQVGRCDPQPGYPPPSERPGCEAAQGGRSSRGH